MLDDQQSRRDRRSSAEDRAHRLAARRRLIAVSQRFRRERSGQALLEFAIVAPLFVIVLLFSIWLWEVVQIKLKLQEAARYAAWDATAFRLHSYASAFYSQGNPFNTAAMAVAAETKLRYMDLDSLSASWSKAYLTISSWGAKDPSTGNWYSSVNVVVPPAAGDWLNMVSTMKLLQMIGAPVMGGEGGIGAQQMSGNELEEIVPGGQFANTVAGMIGPLVSFLHSASYVARPGGKPNVVATALVGLNRAPDREERSAGSGLGGAVRLTGSPTWGFNRRGYVKAYATVSVRNDWFSANIFGQPIFRRQDIELQEEYGLLADAWDLDQAASVDRTKIKTKSKDDSKAWGLLGSAGRWALSGVGMLSRALGFTPVAGGGYPEQVDRMFFMQPKARSVAKSFMRTFVKNIGLAAGAAGAALPTAWTQEDTFFFPALTSHVYVAKDDVDKGKPQPGWMTIAEDGLGIDGSQKYPMYYNTAPLVGEYAKALQNRGKYFMGCPDAEQLGCQRGLAQANPFADYTYRGQ